MTSPVSLYAADDQVFDLELSELMHIKVTSAGRKEQNFSDVSAAIYAISQEDIRNSGATSVPELLRLVPGVQVAQITASSWAVSSRGFNNSYANKLLVQVDGRSIYSPSFSGVYWDSQIVMLEDIERIEVIRGPGATLWGANAVNGIINIITKSSSDSIGWLASTGAGDHEKAMVSVRYGRQFGENSYGRFYAQYQDRGEYENVEDSTDAHDDWSIGHAGIRLDGDVGLDNSWTFQGDFYDEEAHQQVSPYWVEESFFPLTLNADADATGHNLLMRWQHRNSQDNTWTLQAYYDYSERNEVFAGQSHQVADLDFQHRFLLGQRNELIWGLGYRSIQDDFDNTYMVFFDPEKRTSEIYSMFLQDEITLLKDQLWLTLGSKLEDNDYTGSEIQPSARVLWKPASRHRVWGSVSKAVRTPSRAESSGQVLAIKFPLSLTPEPTSHDLYIFGDSNVVSEELIATEAGYRFLYGNKFSCDLALFLNKYDNLISYDDIGIIPPGLPEGVRFGNNMDGRSYGFETSLNWLPVDWISSQLNYSYIKLEMDMDGTSNNSSRIDYVIENSSPRHQVSLRTKIDLNDNLTLNLFGRYVDEVKTPSVTALQSGFSIPDYGALDANVIWKIKDQLELMLAGKNLFSSAQAEFVNEYFTQPVAIEPSAYVKLTWNY